MKRCLACDKVFGSHLTSCPSCRYQPLLWDNFEIYAPQLANESSGFRAEYFEKLMQYEEGHFWFSNRNRLILKFIDCYCQKFESMLEIGCGTGHVTSKIVKKFEFDKFYASDILPAGLSVASKRLSKVKLFQMDARNIPYVDEFDLICIFDVLEHIAEDSRALQQIYQALRPLGVLLLTVPQHEWLWSATDEYACHVRRYSAKDIHEKLHLNNFAILRSTSFLTLLLPIMIGSRLLEKFFMIKKKVETELCPHKIINSLFDKILEVERKLIFNGIDFPFGGSRLIAAVKQ